MKPKFINSQLTWKIGISMKILEYRNAPKF